MGASGHMSRDGGVTELEGRPVLKAGCRLAPSGDVLLIPEGVLRLHGPARRILEACDGTQTVPEIVAKLASEFRNAEPVKVSEETAAFLAKLVEKGVVEFV
jgi:pyrroloquinoline quinone biosynthesis protein D